MAESQTPTAEARLAALEERLALLESVLRCVPAVGILSGVAKAMGSPPAEPQTELERPVEPWKHLVARRHPWRRQLYLKGRNMTVRQLVGGVKANRFSEEQAAANYDLPVEAIREALTYAEENAALLDLEAAYERFLLALGGKRRGPQPVPR